jgi:N-acetylglucosamine kinase-like BadF-type ATPase
VVDRILLGIDGGGTKTRCLVASAEGRILGEGISGPSNYQAVGQERASAAIKESVELALAAAGFSAPAVLAGAAGAPRIAAVCAGLAGVGRPEDQPVAQAMCSFLGDVPLLAVSDARIALAGALEGGPGVTLIAGTGSIALGLKADGEMVRAGGWGWVLGDEGSGFAIGKAALQAALGANDGSAPETILQRAICQLWQLDRIEGAIRKVYADPIAGRVEIAGLVPAVVAAAEAGDGPAQAILAQAGRDLGRLAVTVLRKLDLPKESPQFVAVTGGVATSVALVRRPLATYLAEHAPGAQLIDARKEPAEGALILARDLIKEETR